MKKTIFISFVLLLPYLVGLLQYQNAEIVIQNLTEKTDLEIEETLRTFDFDLSWHERPDFWDYYKAGGKSIQIFFTPIN